jgi:hypothetical protein
MLDTTYYFVVSTYLLLCKGQVLTYLFKQGKIFDRLLHTYWTNKRDTTCPVHKYASVTSVVEFCGRESTGSRF